MGRPAEELGRFIVLEGIDGAGTTTQAEAISLALRAEGRTVLTTREPSDRPVGALLRQALSGAAPLSGGKSFGPETLALLFAADRTDHLASEVIPALERGEVVICDRYLLSSLAYQGAVLPEAWIEQINARAITPDLTLFIEVDVKVAASRRASRGGAPELFDDEPQQTQIARQYLSVIGRRQKRERILKLDGSRPIDEVTRMCLSAISEVALAAKRAVPRDGELFPCPGTGK